MNPHQFIFNNWNSSLVSFGINFMKRNRKSMASSHLLGLFILSRLSCVLYMKTVNLTSKSWRPFGITCHILESDVRIFIMEYMLRACSGLYFEKSLASSNILDISKWIWLLRMWWIDVLLYVDSALFQHLAFKYYDYCPIAITINLGQITKKKMPIYARLFIHEELLYLLKF